MRERDTGFPQDYASSPERREAQPDAATQEAPADRTAPLPSSGRAGRRRNAVSAAATAPLDSVKGDPSATVPIDAATLNDQAAPQDSASTVRITREDLPAIQPEVGDLPGEPAAGGAEEGGREPAPEPSDEDAGPRRPTKRLIASPKSRKVVAGVLVVVALLAVAAILFSWNRWYRFDDHADFQGQWYVAGTAVPVTIDESTIQLTEDVTYQYEMNPQEKTLRYTFGPMQGQGRYWFSDDRQYLVITDGDKFTGSGTAFDDLLHMFTDLPGKITGGDLRLPEGEGIIAFCRTADAEALAQQEAEAAAKAAAEEAARREEERRAAEEEAAWEEEYYYYEEEEVVEETPIEEAPAEDELVEDVPAEEGSDEEYIEEG